MKITKVERQQKIKNRLNIYIDGEFAFGLAEFLVVDHGLFVGKELTGEDIGKIKKADELSKAMNKAYNFLSYRGRSEKEMTDKLSEVFEPEIIEKAIVRLCDHGYINDREFAEAWVRDRGGSRGTRALRSELVKKGVSREIIDEVLLGVGKETEFECALKLVRSKEKYRLLNRTEAYKKVGPFLMRRGYSYEVVKKVIEEVYPK